jgi:hypothetical protein
MTHVRPGPRPFMRRTLRERINGLLIGERTYPIILVLVVNQFEAKGERQIRVLDTLDAVSLKGVPDGKYTLHYTFDGDKCEKPVRVLGERLLFGH